MVQVYILRSLKTHRYYTGSSQDLFNRLQEHNSGETASTRTGIPWELIWSEAYPTRAGAQHRERQIKSRGASRFLNSLRPSAR
jgi:putative endonuclease